MSALCWLADAITAASPAVEKAWSPTRELSAFRAVVAEASAAVVVVAFSWKTSGLTELWTTFRMAAGGVAAGAGAGATATAGAGAGAAAGAGATTVDATFSARSSSAPESPG